MLATSRSDRFVKPIVSLHGATKVVPIRTKSDIVASKILHCSQVVFLREYSTKSSKDLARGGNF